VYGTDGSGAQNLIVPTGAARKPRSEQTAVEVEDDSGNIRTGDNLFMDGAEIFNFTLSAVPKAVAELLARSGKSPEDIDLFVFHQANRYMLEHLRKRLQIPAEKFIVNMAECGNTVSSTIPIAMKLAADAGQLRSGMTLMLVGFGVGYSWGATLLRWN
jgi:3-oxoacyl-[acyl-carrier-protein] synthase-3